MSVLVLAMTIVVILVEDRWPVTAVMSFALVMLVPAATVDLFVLLGSTADRPEDPLSRLSRPSRCRRSRRHPD